MRNAVIVAAADVVMFVVAFITGSVWAAAAVILLALVGLLLVAGELRAERRAERDENEEAAEPALMPENFVPDIADSEQTDVTDATAAADDYGEDDFPFGEPLSLTDPGEGRPRSPSSPGG